MPNASVKKIIPCKKKDLINMILDIEKYPEFVPWCLNGKIHRKKDLSDMIEIEADLTVGKKFINQTYKSHVTYYKAKDKIIVNNIGGPLKHLNNVWNIREINNQSEIDFFFLWFSKIFYWMNGRSDSHISEKSGSRLCSKIGFICFPAKSS